MGRYRDPANVEDQHQFQLLQSTSSQSCLFRQGEVKTRRTEYVLKTWSQAVTSTVSIATSDVASCLTPRFQGAGEEVAAVAYSSVNRMYS